ncbi:DUF1285 domain-containing protein [Shewanella olleyana]|uniref:DUF1285 domain-containing protein n=1 Tax=Shewanella olleyana TaxID=135626 RepID=UPI00200E292E|nr:DUF1285 domain-containing protein [Shewanella olleyana]MCL1067967.1 DUF1285 domain-containing protein [Shewanella olleyana]
MAEPINIAKQLGQLSTKHSDNNGVELCSETPMLEINGEGEWFYLNSPLPAKFAKLFSSVLNCIDGEFFLITPVEKVKVLVKRHAIVLVDYEANENGLTFISSIGTEHAIANTSAVNLLEDAIEIQIERGVIAGLGRACYYRYINQFVTD